MKSFFAWFFAGCFFLALAPDLMLFEGWRLRNREPYFQPPVLAAGNRLKLRRDTYGKGHFGASRNGGRLHKGIDCLAPVGGAVFAAKSGRVRRAETDKGYGLFVEIAHPGGWLTRYAHLSRLDVRPGQWVTAQSIIGHSGASGNAESDAILPHVHFEIRTSRDAVDPSRGFFAPDLKIGY